MHCERRPAPLDPALQRLAECLRPLTGSRIALIAPAGGVPNERIDTARSVLQAAGIDACLGAHARDHYRYLAGTAAARLADLHAALELPCVDAVWCLRGGYGSAQFVQSIDWERIPSNVSLIGYSDMSVLLEAFRQRGRHAIHAPVATELALPRDTPADQAERASSMASLVACLNGALDAWPLIHHSGQVSARAGTLIGGNLTTLASVAGTPAALRLTEDSILVLEDVGEAEFRLERCLHQLLESINTVHLQAICLGCFEHCELACGLDSFIEICAEYASARDIALYHGAPVGHGVINHAWRVGAAAEIRDDRLVFDNHNV